MSGHELEVRLYRGRQGLAELYAYWQGLVANDSFESIRQGITGGYPDGTYRPENRVTRAEMAVFLVNTFNIPLP